MAQGYENVFRWATKRLLAEAKSRTKQLGNELCKNADIIYYKLKSAGAAVPKQSKWNGLSCDQKIAFVTALGPYGAAMLAAGTLLAGWASDAPKEMKKYANAVSNIVGDVSDAASDLGKKLNPLDGLSRWRVEPPAPIRLSGISLSLNGGSMQRQDVDFGFLGSAPGHRGRFNGFGGPALDTAAYVTAGGAAGGGNKLPVTEVSTTSSFDWNRGLDSGVSLLDSLFGKKTKGSAQGPATVFVQGGGSALPSWVVPVAGLAAVAGVAYFVFFKK